MPWKEFTVVISKARKDLFFSFVGGNVQLRNFDTAFGSGFSTSTETTRPKVIDFRLKEITFGHALFDAGFTQKLRVSM